VASGILDLEALKRTDLPTDPLRSRLRAIKGVGDYATANIGYGTGPIPAS